MIARPTSPQLPFSLNLLVFSGAGLAALGLAPSLLAFSFEAVARPPTEVCFRGCYHLLWLVFGYGAMFWFASLKPGDWRPLDETHLFGALALLDLTVLAGLLADEGEAWRLLSRHWLGPDQAAELAKFGALLVLAGWLARHRRALRHPLSHLGLVFPLVGIAMLCALLLVLRQGTTALLLVLVAGGLLLRGGISRFLVLLLGCFPVLGAGWFIWSDPVRRARFLAFYQPADGRLPGFEHRPLQAALEQGGWTGTFWSDGPLGSWQPSGIGHQHALAGIAQDFGGLGVLAIGALFLVFVTAGIHVSRHARNQFTRLLGFGYVTLVGWQAFLHLVFVAAWFPLPGAPLPFARADGPEQCLALMGLGMLFSIARSAQPVR